MEEIVALVKPLGGLFWCVTLLIFVFIVIIGCLAAYLLGLCLKKFRKFSFLQRRVK